MEINVEAVKRSLLGTAIGDSLGLPYEGLSASRARKLMPFPLRQRLLGHRGTVSDDTVQSAIVLSALIRCEGDVALFQGLVAVDLRKWFLAVPPGIGLATIKACLRLCVGFPPSRSGVSSAGNGAAMRSAVIGAALCDEPELRIQFVEASARITHTHPDAIAGAQIVALAAARHARGERANLREQYPNWKWELAWMEKGPTGYVLQSVNAVVAVLDRGLSFEESIEAAIALGGDTDTVAAMVGGIIGCESMPAGWADYIGWPQPREILDGNLKVSYFRLLGQHLVALPAILVFGFRRLFPPY